jgi:NADP-dependent 3-hydroxy acid dehydrogenase YdfG
MKRNAIIIGATSGIGEALTEELSLAGYMRCSEFIGQESSEVKR